MQLLLNAAFIATALSATVAGIALEFDAATQNGVSPSQPREEPKLYYISNEYIVHCSTKRVTGYCFRAKLHSVRFRHSVLVQPTKGYPPSMRCIASKHE